MALAHVASLRSEDPYRKVGAVAIEEAQPGCQLEHQYAEREDVGARIRCFATRLLWGHVRWRSENASRAGESRTDSIVFW